MKAHTEVSDHPQIGLERNRTSISHGYCHRWPLHVDLPWARTIHCNDWQDCARGEIHLRQTGNGETMKRIMMGVLALVLGAITLA
jgi:hypothetical protein